MGESPTTTSKKPDMRQRTQAILLVLAYILALFIVVIQILTLVAGKWITHDSDGTPRLALSSLAIVKFNGIIPSPSEPDSYLVTMHFFPSSFGYEYPSASKAGIISSRPDLPRGLVEIGDALSVPPSAWACLRSGQERCTSPFYAAFRLGRHETPVALAYVAQAYALAVVLLVLAGELLIAVRPSWLRCQCTLPCLRRVCPCPRGGRAEIEALPPAFWDRYRAWTWPFLVPAAFLPAFALALDGLVLRGYVGRARGGDVDARFGTGFVATQAACLGAAFAAAVCVYVRKALGRKASWMEQQGAVAEAGARGVAGDGEGVLSKEYSDADPDATLLPAGQVQEAVGKRSLRSA